MGGYPSYGTVPGGFPRPGGEATDGAASTVEVGRKLGVNLGGGRERGGGVWADGNLHSEKSEYSCAVYFDGTNYGPVQGSEEEAGGTGGDVVVVTGMNWPDGYKGDSLSGVRGVRGLSGGIK